MAKISKGKLAGIEAAKAYLRRPYRLYCEEDDPDLLEYTNRPELYKRRRVRRLLLPVLAALPNDFFRVVTDERKVFFDVSPHPGGLVCPHPDYVVQEDHSRAIAIKHKSGESWETGAWMVKLCRIAIELLGPLAFHGVVVHELCHVYRGDDVDQLDLSDEEWQSIEDEAVALACRLGFRRETEAYLQAQAELWGPGGTGRLP